MRKIALLGASALILTFGAAAASAEPFNPITDAPGTITGAGYYGYGQPLTEGRAAAIDNSGPFFGAPVPFVGAAPFSEGSAPGAVVLQQFHEAGGDGNGAR